MNLVNNNLNKGHNCFYSTLNILLSSCKIDLCESDLYFLCGGTNLNMNRSISKKESAPESIWNYESYEGLLDRLSFRINIKFLSYNSDCLEQYKNKLNVILSEGNSVMIAVDTKCLKYQPLQNNYNYVHFLNITSLDINNNISYIKDTYILNASGNVDTYEGEYDLKSLLCGIKKIYWIEICDYELLLDDFIDYVKKEILEFCENGYKALYELFYYLYKSSASGRVRKDDYLKLIVLLENRHIVSSVYAAHFAVKFLSQNALLSELNQLKSSWGKILVRIYISHIDEKLERTSRIYSNSMTLIARQKDIYLRLLNNI